MGGGGEVSDVFNIQNSLKWKDSLLSLLLKFASWYDGRMVQEHTEGLKLLGTHQLVICADTVHLLGENILWREVVVISKDDDPDVSAEKAK
jgi:hypothetical protein